MNENRLSLITAARLPLESLEVIGPLRGLNGIYLAEQGDRCWVVWEKHHEAIVALLLPVFGVEWFSKKDDLWFPLDSLLPELEPPPKELIPLERFLIPESYYQSPTSPIEPESYTLKLVPSSVPRPICAVRVPRDAFHDWFEKASFVDFSHWQIAWSHASILILGKDIPQIPESERFWGNQVWLPLGSELEIPISEKMIRQAARIPNDQYLLLTRDSLEWIPKQGFGPCTRAGVRLLKLAN